MRRPKTLAAFTPEQYQKAHDLLATRVAFMMGRKIEEGDWADVYCSAKGILNRGWSNLNIDVIHKGLGVEHKMLRPSGDKSVRETFGTQLMHPSATRAIRISDGDPAVVMRDILQQYAAFLEKRREFVKKDTPGVEPDMRTGWVLWQSNLREFVYFEEETLAPNPDDYVAEWHESPARGGRKESKSLWIIEKETRLKRYSVTTSAGAKIQPYFGVPPQSDPNLYYFKVQGEEYKPGLIRIWIPNSSARELRRAAGELNVEQLHKFILETLSTPAPVVTKAEVVTEQASAIILSADSYAMLTERFANAVSDAHMIQLLLEAYSHE